MEWRKYFLRDSNTIVIVALYQSTLNKKTTKMYTEIMAGNLKVNNVSNKNKTKGIDCNIQLK